MNRPADIASAAGAPASSPLAVASSKASRVQQIVEWLGRDFDGVIIFDEAHAMANAAGGKGARGDVSASQQGRAGLLEQGPGCAALGVDGLSLTYQRIDSII